MLLIQKNENFLKSADVCPECWIQAADIFADYEKTLKINQLK